MPDLSFPEIILGPREMGMSLGSGRVEKPGARRRAVEECERLPVWAFTAGARPPGSEGVGLAFTTQRLGTRTWLVCPGCGRRASSLYRPAEVAPWKCRECHGLTYLSRRHHKRDEAMLRVESEVLAILQRTDGDWDEVLRMMEGASHWKWLAMIGWLIRVEAGE